MVGELTNHLARGTATRASSRAIGACGKVLAKHFPPGHVDKNELPNHLIVLDAYGGVRSTGAVARCSPPERAGTSALVGWVLFDWATQPFYTLVVTFLFAPYFVNGFMADPARGSALWAYATGIAELIAAAHRAGARRHRRWRPAAQALDRRLLGAAGGRACAACGSRRPAAPTSLPLVLLSFGLATIGAELATVFTNAMMVSLVSDKQLGTLSGFGWATGYVGGLGQPGAGRGPPRRRSA